MTRKKLPYSDRAQLGLAREAAAQLDGRTLRPRLIELLQLLKKLGRPPRFNVREHKRCDKCGHAIRENQNTLYELELTVKGRPKLVACGPSNNPNLPHIYTYRKFLDGYASWEVDRILPHLRKEVASSCCKTKD